MVSEGSLIKKGPFFVDDDDSEEFGDWFEGSCLSITVLMTFPLRVLAARDEREEKEVRTQTIAYVCRQGLSIAL